MRIVKVPVVHLTIISWFLLLYLTLATFSKPNVNVAKNMAATASRRVLLIAPSGEMGSNEVEAFHNACQIWNTLIGRPVFIISKGPEQNPDIWLTRVYSYDEKNIMAVTYYQYDKILVSYREALKFNRPTLEKVLIHELGHVLGLGHSEDKGSVMYPSIGDASLPNEEDIIKARVDWSQEF